jgi:PqqD family protein of HPr-rel-A system
VTRAAPGTRWTTVRGFPLLWRSWGEGEYVVYHTGSADTHHLNEVGAEVLRQLDGRPVNVEELTVRVAESLDCEAGEEFAHHIEGLVLQLDELGLIEPST